MSYEVQDHLSGQNIGTHPFGERAISLEPGLDEKEMVINFGPQHPACHGTLRMVMTLDGEKVAGERSATSEKGVHLATLTAHPEVGGVVHCHAVHASMFAVAHIDIPAAIDEFIVYIGG